MKHPIPAAAFDDRLAFLGATGSGKTYAASGVVERLLERKSKVVIVDPLGVWYGLRLLADGKTASSYDVVIFGGPHGDLPLNEAAGALIGETAVTTAENCIIDISELPTKASEIRFMTAMLDAMYRKARGRPFHLVIDEADIFAPQKPQKGEETLLNRMEQIVRRGRVKGFTPWLITQRPAVLNKNVLSQVQGLVAFQLTSSQDRKAIDAWVGGQADVEQAKTIKATLPTFGQGDAYLWLPQRGILERVHFPEKMTFDSSRQRRRGEAHRELPLKSLDLTALKEKLSTVEAETKANDPKLLKAEIAKLRADLTKAQQNIPKNIPPSADALEKAEAHGFERAKKELSAQFADASRAANETIAKLRKGMEIATKFIAEVNAVNGVVGEIDTAMVQKALSDAAQYATKMIEKHVERRAAQVTKIRADSERIVETLKALLDDVSPLDVLPRQPQVTISAPAVRAASTRRSERSASSSAGGMSPMARKIVDVLEASYPVSLTFKSAAMRAGASPRSSAFRGYEKEIIASGEVDIVDDRMIAKRHGDALIGDPIEAFAAKLQPSWAAMLRVIANAVAPLSKEEVAVAAGVSPTSSGLNAGLKELCSLALIQRLSDGSYELAAEIREAA